MAGCDSWNNVIPVESGEGRGTRLLPTLTHQVMLCEPDVVLDGGFLDFETRTGFDLRQEVFHPDGMDPVGPPP